MTRGAEMTSPSVGMDLVEVERIAKLTQSERFLKRIFTDRELADCRKRAFPERALAARFAAKEATAKALGTGIGKNLRWKEIELTTDANKRPHIRLHGKWANEPMRISVSITHTRTTAGAVVVILP
jgi:holo-[acyl-carrier protein] synthase